ncbi:MAG: hypothetical protein ABJA34_07635 [Pseudonocardiales bacterium]
MTSPASGPHPGVETLSDLQAGVLAGTAQESEVSAHLAGCPSCAERVGLLRNAQSLLAGLPAPSMPADVIARIDAALTDAALIDGVQAEPTAVAVLADRRRSRRRVGAGAVAAAAAVLFVAAVGIGTFQQRAGSDKSATASSRGSPGQGAGLVPQASGRTYTPATLAAGVRSLLAGVPPAAQGFGTPIAPGQSTRDSAVPADPATTLARLRQPAALSGCVTELAGRPGVVPLAVDYAVFQGRPAAIVVLPDPDPAKVQAWAVGPDCRPSQADVLRYQVVPRVG